MTLFVDFITCLDNKVSIETGAFFDCRDPMYKEIIEKITEPLLNHGSRLTPEKLCVSWAFFQEELDEVPGYIEFVSGPKDGGEFRNPNGKYNGKVYLHYCFEDEDDEWSDEMVIVLKE